MKKWAALLSLVVILATLLACGQPPAQTTPPATGAATPTPTVQTPSGKYLTPNPVETGKPIYGGVIKTGYWIPRTFDAHQYAGFGPTATLPVFNQLVMYDLTYKDTVPETIIGDLADRWEMSNDDQDITFHLRPGVNWQDGVPFTADDVIYSLQKMTDVNRSAISAWFPAFDSVDKIDELTVVVHLKYASAGFLLALAQGESQIQPLHLAGVDAQTKEFMVGTGPFTLTGYLPGVRLEYQRNPNYWKKDKDGNQLPYLDGIILYHSSLANAQNELIGRRLDILGASSGAGTVSAYEYLKSGAPELLWVKRNRFSGATIYLNVKHKPLDDIRIRRAIGLLINEDDLITGYAGSLEFGQPGAGIFHPAVGLPKDEVTKLMGWDKPFEERVTEAKRLLTEAGYPNGFDLNILAQRASGAPTVGHPGASLVYADHLRRYLNINAQVQALARIELEKRIASGDYDMYAQSFNINDDPAQFATWFGTDGQSRWSHYANPQLDSLMANLDRVIDPAQRQQDIWSIERILLTDLPALPTGVFPTRNMFYYPHVKNLRWQTVVYSGICRLEDVWVDPSLKPANFGTP